MVPTTTDLPPLLTTQQVARILQYNRAVVRRKLCHGEIPGIKLGGNWRVSRDYVESLLNGELVEAK